MVIYGGVQFTALYLPFGPGFVSFGLDVGFPVTVFFTVVMINSLNFIDGLDGLAAGRLGHHGAVVLRLRVPPRRPRLHRRHQLGPAAQRRAGRRVRRASSPTTSRRPGSSWATRARCSSGSCSRRARPRPWPRPTRSRTERARRLPALRAAADVRVRAGPAVRRPAARDHPPRVARGVAVQARQAAPAPPAAAARTQPPPRRADALLLVRPARRGRRVAVDPPGRCSWASSSPCWRRSGWSARCMPSIGVRRHPPAEVP